MIMSWVCCVVLCTDIKDPSKLLFISHSYILSILYIKIILRLWSSINMYWQFHKRWTINILGWCDCFLTHLWQESCQDLSCYYSTEHADPEHKGHCPSCNYTPTHLCPCSLFAEKVNSCRMYRVWFVALQQ